MTRNDQLRSPRTSHRLTWLLLAIAIPLLVAGVTMPNGLVIAAGLVAAGLIGLADRR